ncbi:uncharacterized protein EI97DRAFT_482232 [Westerdykella ornata]|uniref:Uncharacterized protein n=1 Tax=Westerdykella ornata TaxID=318751 RepID=A0A6A6JU07_WESOR|nr:uncharacterized protein EI97DRAFT_482232 [Westerdykella ornata]KAF2279593.1 hypothetical protein EI97DRAFT_482232 [Westerdykella ornata]
MWAWDGDRLNRLYCMLFECNRGYVSDFPIQTCRCNKADGECFANNRPGQATAILIIRSTQVHWRGYQRPNNGAGGETPLDYWKAEASPGPATWPAFTLHSPLTNSGSTGAGEDKRDETCARQPEQQSMMRTARTRPAALVRHTRQQHFERRADGSRGAGEQGEEQGNRASSVGS